MEVGIKNQYSFAPKIPKSISKIGLFGGLIKGRFPLNSLVLISGEGGISKSLIIQNILNNSKFMSRITSKQVQMRIFMCR